MVTTKYKDLFSPLSLSAMEKKKKKKKIVMRKIK